MTLTNMHRACAGLLLATAMAAGGCATAQPSKELLDARAAYQRSEQGKAREYNPAALHEAKVALDKAENAFENDPDSQVARDEAYVAMRRAERAEVEASTLSWKQRQEKARADATQAQAKGLQKAETELASARQELQQEKSAREAALAKLEAANAAAVKEEPRGTVITMAGGVLFASGKSVLLPGAQTSMNQVVEALRDQQDKKILIEGHTDSRGSDATNQALSKARADAVGAYFASHGVPQDRITTAGLGPSRPVADNDTAEGRANNRRVEIIIQNSEPK